MEAVKYIWLYLGTTLAFFAIDMVWLGVVAKDFYRDALKPLLLQDFNKAAAFVFYSLFIVGILIFAVLPALKSGDVGRAALYGAMFGFFCYATYDLTNLATLKDWPIKIVVVDMIWGTVLTAAVASAGYGIGRWLGF